MKTRFSDRTEAGNLLAGRLRKYADRGDVLVLALPRGGVPVGAIVAERLHAPLDVLVVRKLGVPGHAELAMGAIAAGGVRILNADLVAALQISPPAIEAVAKQEERELNRREQIYRGGRPAPPIRGRTVILVDDGIATGSTIRAAIDVVRDLGARLIVVATPVIAAPTYDEMRRQADEVVAVMTPSVFHGVGEWFDDFRQTTDAEVLALLAKAKGRQGAAPVGRSQP